MKKLIIQITSGNGPAECCRAVACVQRLMLAQAKTSGLQITNGITVSAIQGLT